MFKPELRTLQSWESVLVSTEDGYAVGRFKGNTHPKSESFEIHILDIMTDEIKEVSYYHKEDLYENNKENAVMLQG